MRKSEYDKHAINALMDTFGSLQRHAADCVREKNRKRRRRGVDRSVIQEKHGSHPFIPNSVYATLHQFIHAFDYLRKGEDYYPRFSFLDAGCGVGNVMMLARGVGFNVHGLELDPATIEFAKGMNPSWKEIQEQNILTYNEYKKFDVIYYYCPFSNPKEEMKFEERVEDQMKVGALLIPCAKLSYRIVKDRRFRKVRLGPRGTNVNIFERIKGGKGVQNSTKSRS